MNPDPQYRCYFSELIVQCTSIVGVADPGCLSRILVFVYPGPLIPDPKTATKRDVKKFFVLPILFLTWWRKKFEPVYQCCGSGMFIPDPDFYPSRIPKQQQNRGVKKIRCHFFLCSLKFHKWKIIWVFKCWRKKCGSIFKELYYFLFKKLSLSSQKYGFGIPDPGVKKAPDPGSGSATLSLQRIIELLLSNK